MNLKKVLEAVKSKSEFRKTVEIMGSKFDLCVLSVDDEIKANTLDPNIKEEEGTAIYNTLKKNILSFSLRKIDDEEIPAVVETEEGEGENKKTVKKERHIYLREAVKDWNAQLVDSLFQVYIDIKDQAEANIKNEIKYQWYKEPEKRKEELIKKIQGEEEKQEEKKPEESELKEVKIKEKVE